MTNLKMQNLNHVRTLAQIEAKKTKQNQVIINSYDGKYKVFRIIAERDWNGKFVELVRYTEKVKRPNVLRDNGNRKPGTIKGKSKGKSKSGKTE